MGAKDRADELIMIARPYLRPRLIAALREAYSRGVSDAMDAEAMSRAHGQNVREKK